MKHFETLDVAEALAYAASGGQALHTHRIIPDREKAPRCFVVAVNRGEQIAHLFDTDIHRLHSTARMLGVRVIHIDRQGTNRQHIDLCGTPLRRALALCKQDEKEGG